MLYVLEFSSLQWWLIVAVRSGGDASAEHMCMSRCTHAFTVCMQSDWCEPPSQKQTQTAAGLKTVHAT
jgi:hypothetical protein